jgi:hypothetical protein
MAASGGNGARLDRSKSRRQSIIPSFDLFFRSEYIVAGIVVFCRTMRPEASVLVARGVVLSVGDHAVVALLGTVVAETTDLGPHCHK